MTMQTEKGAVTFWRPFGLGAYGKKLPGRRYPTKTDEEYLKGLSLLAYRRTDATQFKPDPLPLGATEATGQLEGALAEDAVQAPIVDVDPAKAES